MKHLANELHAKIAANPDSTMAREFFETINSAVRIFNSPTATDRQKLNAMILVSVAVSMVTTS